ncbi:uncharacterized protein Dwil_GK28238 [Drosophila willistoni]|uniref:Uncharacterized protein n=1 Tax=Drosophila willistoni TaxID=7260 RepID=A0A0Q9X2J7_DROWI|nr:uncharacterized protein Dwil_GK28238 [Drosophila willistoni]
MLRIPDDVSGTGRLAFTERANQMDNEDKDTHLTLNSHPRDDLFEDQKHVAMAPFFVCDNEYRGSP